MYEVVLMKGDRLFRTFNKGEELWKAEKKLWKALRMLLEIKVEFCKVRVKLWIAEEKLWKD